MKNEQNNETIDYLLLELKYLIQNFENIPLGDIKLRIEQITNVLEAQKDENEYSFRDRKIDK